MIEKYFEGEIPQPLPYDINGPVDIIGEIQLKNFTETVNPDFEFFIERLSFNHALDKIWFVINHANKLIEDEAPWNLWKTKNIDKLSGVLYTLAETLRIIAIYLFPFIPSAAEEMWKQLNVSGDLSKINFESEGKWGLLKPGTKIKKGPALFPRIETAKKF
jgi:methionyl-tRNA synthetase